MLIPVQHVERGWAGWAFGSAHMLERSTDYYPTFAQLKAAHALLAPVSTQRPKYDERGNIIETGRIAHVHPTMANVPILAHKPTRKLPTADLSKREERVVRSFSDLGGLVEHRRASKRPKRG